MKIASFHADEKKRVLFLADFLNLWRWYIVSSERAWRSHEETSTYHVDSGVQRRHVENSRGRTPVPLMTLKVVHSELRNLKMMVFELTTAKTNSISESSCE